MDFKCINNNILSSLQLVYKKSSNKQNLHFKIQMSRGKNGDKIKFLDK